MNIEQMFAKPIDRDMKGVIKVGQDDDQNIRQELEEYVVTRELQKHFRDFFASYKNGIMGNTDKMGVWISGFFGSGKSHFLKILSYLLANKTIDGKTALAYFEEDNKIKDPMVLADMKLAASTSTDVVLFNIDSKGEQNGKQDKDAIVAVFLKVFNEMQGFCGAIPHLADLERNLTEKGKYDAFKTAFEDSFGTPWEEARNDFDFIQDDVVDALTAIGYMSEEAARNWCERTTNNYSISIEDFAKLVKKYIDQKGNDHHVVFLVDEIGQYIGDDSKLMLNLQTVTEELGIKCNGKAWIIVTSQQDIDAVTKVKGNDFSKIQGRFDTRLSLSSANVDEVIRERILKKTDAATQTLQLYYDQKETILKNLILFNDGVEKKLYATRTNFAEVYPFVPYQFDLLGSVLTSIRTHGASGKHLAEGERSMLALFKESASRIRMQQAGSIVPFHMFYDALEQFLDHSHRGVIMKALDNDALNPEHKDESFDVNVLKTLFMIKYVKEIKANKENITSLMVSHADEDRMELAQRVEDALRRLEKQTLIQKNGDVYVFLTNEEQEISIHIKSMAIEMSEITQQVSALIFDDILNARKYQYPAFGGRYAFSFNQIVDDKSYKQGQNYDISLKILTPDSDERGDDATMRMLSGRKEQVLVVLPPDRTFMDELRLSLQIEKFLRMDTASGIARFDEIKDAKKRELSDRKASAKLFLIEALKEADIYANGDKVQTGSKDVASRINEVMGKLVDTVYNKLSYIDTAMSEGDVRKVLDEQTQQLTIDGSSHTPNSNALRDMRQHIADRTAVHTKVSMKALIERFTKIPYGFVEADVWWLVAKLFKDGDIAMYVNSEQVSLVNKKVDELVRYITRKEYQDKLMIEKREQATEKQKKSVREIMKDLFHASLTNDDDDAMMSSFLQYAGSLKTEIEKLEAKYDMQPKYPGKKVLQEGKYLLQDVLTLKNTNEFFAAVDKGREDYLDFAEDFEPVKNFFAGEQVSLFDKAMNLMAIYEDSRTYIVDTNLEQVVAQINAVLSKQVPYSDIHKLPMLMDTFTDSYNDLLQQMSIPVREAIEDARKRVFEALHDKLCKDTFYDAYIRAFDDLRNKADTCNNVARLQGIKLEADALKTRCLQEISDKETALLQQKAQEEAKNKPQVNTGADKVAEPGSTDSATMHVSPQTQYVVKKRKVVSIKTITGQNTWNIETEADVKTYIAELEQKLMNQLEDNTIIQIEF